MIMIIVLWVFFYPQYYVYKGVYEVVYERNIMNISYVIFNPIQIFLNNFANFSSFENFDQNRGSV